MFDLVQYFDLAHHAKWRLNSFILQYLFHNQFAFCFRKWKHYIKNIWLLITEDLHSKHHSRNTTS